MRSGRRTDRGRTFERTIEVRVTGRLRIRSDFGVMFLRNWESLRTLVVVPLSAVGWYLCNRHATKGAPSHRKVGF